MNDVSQSPPQEQRAAESVRRTLRWSYLGRMDYEPCSELQARVRDRLLAGEGEEALLFVEHPHTYTLGRNADAADVIAGDAALSARGVSVSQSTRGGQVTYHGPGQLVGYPIVDLNPDRRDLRRYVSDLEQVLIDVLAELGVEASGAPDRERIGVWVGDAKIASIGVHVKRWVTTHGFALNLHTDLDYFSGIVACGLPGVTMTSVEELTGRRVELDEAAELCVRHFAQRFERELQHGLDQAAP